MPSTRHVRFAGQAAVASEFSVRGYVVSMPTIDLGDDLFVQNHNTGKTWTIQVSAALPIKSTPNYFQFTIREAAIHHPTASASHFVFALRIKNAWRMCVVPQRKLSAYVRRVGIGTLNQKRGTRTFTFICDPTTGNVACSAHDLSGHLNDWHAWPVVP